MNSTDIIGYAFDGALYCAAHEPKGDEVSAVFLDDGNQGDSCDTCGEYLTGCNPPARVEGYKIKGISYEIFTQRTDPDEYAVKKTSKKGGQVWLTHPERHFETVGGARMAILFDLENN